MSSKRQSTGVGVTFFRIWPTAITILTTLTPAKSEKT